jgi:hypothetical protein
VYSSADNIIAGYQTFTRRMVFQKRDRNGNLLYSVEFGGRNSEGANAIAVDRDGNLYATGYTNSPDFTLTAGDPNATNQQYHAFIMKLDPAGTMIYCYGIGDLPTVGVSARDIAVDDAGNAYVALTRSLATSSGNRDTVGVVALDPTGTQHRTIANFSTDGSSYPSGIVLSPDGRIAIAGLTWSSNYPVTPDAIKPAAKGPAYPGATHRSASGFLSILNPDGSLAYSTYIGGTQGDDYVQAVASDRQGNILVAGITGTSDFTLTPGAYRSGSRIQGHAFVMKWNFSGALQYSALVSGGSEYDSTDGLSLTADANGAAYLAVMTFSPDAPVTDDAFDRTFSGGQSDILVSRLSPDGSQLEWSSFIGTFQFDAPNAIAIDEGSGFYLAGATAGFDFYPSSSPDDETYLNPSENTGSVDEEGGPRPMPFLARFVWPVSANTPAGGAVTVPSPDGAASVSFGSVNAAGTTTLQPVDATALGLPLPGGFILSTGSQAFEIHTTASVTAIQVCLTASGLNDAEFATATILHGVNGAWQIEPTTRDLASRRLCASVTSLSPFAVGFRPDSTAPVVHCAAPPAAWSAANVTLACTASDAGTGLATASDAAFTLSTSVAEGSESASATTSSRQICDLAGNCATAGPIGGLRVDRRAPSAQISAPVNRRYVIREAAAAAYTCSDGGELTLCRGSVANGSPVNTATAGSHTFTVEARDGAGHVTTAATSYSVGYNVRVLFDQRLAVKRGKVLGVAIQLVDAAGANVSAAATTVTVTGLRALSSDAVVPLRDSEWLNPDHTFRYALGGYVYALGTKGLTPGVYALTFQAAGDALVHTVQFSVTR